MENIRIFLETSTIHGLAYISTTRKFSRIFWTLVVIAGFTGAGFLIYQSFENWSTSPITTTIETRPIKEITFPKVTVCPPRNTYTDLNYDLMMMENVTFDDTTRNELSSILWEVMNDNLYESVMKDMERLIDNDRYYNWYHGYTQINLHATFGNEETSATSGSILTQYFGERFDADKVKTESRYEIKIHPLNGVNETNKATLHINIEKVAIKDYERSDTISFNDEIINSDTAHIAKNFTPPSSSTVQVWGRKGYHKIQQSRYINQEDAKKMKQDMMPGFNISWYYSGMVQPEAYFYDAYMTKSFVRYVSNTKSKSQF